MVIYTATAVHFSKVMRSMNSLREDQHFCDIRLKVHSSHTNAHKCVLAASSPYFKSLFLGNFTEASMAEIDLSFVIPSICSLELILNFLYTGAIDITVDNLGIITKLASFFLIDQLREFCQEFMMVTLDLKNCLRYFFYSVDYNFSMLRSKTCAMVEARFHDFIIFEKSSFVISPYQLHLLMTQNLLQYCHVSVVLEFVVDWLLQGQTEKHIAVSTDILNYVNCKGGLHSRGYTELDIESLYDRVKSSLDSGEVDNADKFLRRFRRVITKTSSCSSPGLKTYNLRPHSPKFGQKSEPHTESALVVFAPRKCVIDAVERRLAKGRFFTESAIYTEPIFDVCVYVTRQQMWYHVQTLNDEGVPCTLLDEMTHGVWRFTCMQDKLVFILLGDETLYFLNLRDLSWKSISYRQLEDHVSSNEIYFEVISVVGADQTVYLVLRIRICDDEDFDDVRQVYFRCYRLTEDENWQFVFDTPKYNTEDHDGDTVAIISKGSNEMLIVHGSFSNNCAYAIDMSEENPTIKSLLPEIEESDYCLQNVHIIEGRSQLYVVQQFPTKLMVTFEYKFRSGRLSPVKGNPLQMLVYLQEDTYPCLHYYTLTDGASWWCLEGGETGTRSISKLTEVRIARNRSLVETKHTPPPFPWITAAFAGHLDVDVLSNLKPIPRYLAA